MFDSIFCWFLVTKKYSDHYFKSDDMRRRDQHQTSVRFKWDRLTKHNYISLLASQTTQILIWDQKFGAVPVFEEAREERWGT